MISTTNSGYLPQHN